MGDPHALKPGTVAAAEWQAREMSFADLFDDFMDRETNEYFNPAWGFPRREDRAENDDFPDDFHFSDEEDRDQGRHNSRYAPPRGAPHDTDADGYSYVYSSFLLQFSNRVLTQSIIRP